MAKYWAEINSANEVIETTIFQDDITTAEKAAAVKPLADSNNQYVEYILDGGSRKIMASIGYTYNSGNDSFVVDNKSTNVTIVYQGGSSFTAGNATSNDTYTMTAIKTAASTFTVLASQTQFA